MGGTRCVSFGNMQVAKAQGITVGTLKHKENEGTAELDIGRGVCRGKVLFIDDLVTYEADSPREVQREFEAAVDGYVATCAILGKDPQRPFRGLFNVRVPPELHRAAALRAKNEDVSLKDFVVRALDSLFSNPSGFRPQLLRLRLGICRNSAKVAGMHTTAFAHLQLSDRTVVQASKISVHVSRWPIEGSVLDLAKW